MATKELREARKARVRVLFGENKTDKEIAEVLTREFWPTNSNAVRKVRQGLKLSRLKGGYNGEPMDEAYVLREYEERNPQTQDEIRNVISGIATDVDRHPDHVRRFLRRQGKIPARYEPIPEEQVAVALNLLEQGVPYPEVAKEIGVTYDKLTYRLPGWEMSPEDVSVYRSAKKIAERLGV